MGRALPATCLLWIAARFLPGSPPDAAFVSTLEAVRVRPASINGLAEVVLPGAVGRPGAVLRGEPAMASLVERLREDVDALNEDLVLVATGVAGRIETFPDESAAFRTGGVLVPFFDRSADQLSEVRLDAASRPGRALVVAGDLLTQRLMEPAEDYLLENTARRRELTRSAREIEDALTEASERGTAAIAHFRSECEATIRASAGPFQRRGPGRIIEIVLASLLAAVLRRAIRPRANVPPALPIAAGPTLAVGVLLAVEGTPLLPVDPLRGLSMAFLPASFLIGWGGAAWTSRLASAGWLVGGRSVSEPFPEEHNPSPPSPSSPEKSVNGNESPTPNPEPALPPSTTARSEREVPEDPGMRRVSNPPPSGGAGTRPVPAEGARGASPGASGVMGGSGGSVKLPFFRKSRHHP